MVNQNCDFIILFLSVLEAFCIFQSCSTLGSRRLGLENGLFLSLSLSLPTIALFLVQFLKQSRCYNPVHISSSSGWTFQQDILYILKKEKERTQVLLIL